MGSDARLEPADGADEQLIPGWLVLLVAVLLVCVAGLSAVSIRQSILARRSTAPAAIAQAEATVRSDPNNIGARRDLAYAYQQVQRYDDAIHEYERVLRVSPKDAASLYNEGAVYFAMGQEAKGESRLVELLKFQPRHVLAARLLGDYYASRGRYDALIAVVRPVVAVQPQYADLQCLLGVAYEHTGRAGSARQSYAAALRYVPDMREARAGLRRIDDRK